MERNYGKGLFLKYLFYFWKAPKASKYMFVDKYSPADLMGSNGRWEF